MNKKLLKYLPVQKLINVVAPKLLDGISTMLSAEAPPSLLFELSWADVDPDAYLRAVKLIGEHAEYWKGQPNAVITQSKIEELKRRYKINDVLYSDYFHLSVKEKKLVRILSEAPVSGGPDNRSDSDGLKPFNK